MSKEQSWITGRIGEARTLHPLVTESVSDRMLELLKDRLTKRLLSKTEQTSIAKELIAGMVPAPPEAEQGE